jgi:hypothetical protein
VNTGLYRCLFCGAPSWREPSEQTAPPSYCHESDHGEPEVHELDGEDAAAVLAAATTTGEMR